MSKLEGADKKKALELALSSIEKQFGKGSIMKLGANGAIQKIETLSSGVSSLDYILSGTCPGGIARGRIIECFGPESSGKTTLALHFAAQAQRENGVVAFVDAEHALDPVYASKLGLNIDETLISQPSSGEEALDIVETLANSGAVDLIIVDSVAALVPKAELEGEMSDQQMGLQARLMSKALRKITGAAQRNGTTIFFLNQLRMKIGFVLGNPEVTAGGNGLKFWASTRMDIRRTGQIKEGEEIVGHVARIKIVKNKLAAPFKETELNLRYDAVGFDVTNDLLNFGVQHGVINKGGAWYSYKDSKIGQGEANATRFLKENPKVLEEIKKDLSTLFSPLTAGELPVD